METVQQRSTIHAMTKKIILTKNTFSVLVSLALAALMLIIAAPLHAQDSPQEGDPPERVARLSVIQGNVSLQPAGVDQFSQAETNYPLTSGDRIYVDNTSHAELQSDALALRMGAGADLTLTGMTDQLAQLGLAQGSIHVRSWDLQDGAVVEIDTPNGTITIVRPGDVRIDSYPQDDATVVTVNSGQAMATGPNFSQVVNPGQALKLTGSNPIYAEPVQLSPPDDLDRFDQDRDRRQMSARAAQQQYVNPNMIGYSDLDEYGEWVPQPEYGQVWYPRNIDAEWTPYHNGHWAWVAPWGWTWVESEPWGFAPFHYGRWANFGGRWGWVPGPAIVRPVYSPALVAFVGGPSFSISVGFSGGGLTAWFPLGPRETYVPWYHASPGYVNRVNVTNIYNRNVIEVRNVYNNRTTNIYVNNTTVNNITYVNRTVATTAVPQRAFAAGRPVAAAAVHVDQRQLAQAPVMPHPMITPVRQIMTPSPARAVPANIARPMLQTRVGLAQAVPGAQARPVPVHSLTPQQPEQTHATTPQQNVRQPNPPAPPVPAQQSGAAQRTAQQNSPTPVQRQAPIERPNPTERPAPAHVPTQAPVQVQAQASQPKPQPRPVDQPRPLINHSEPPPAQPTFVQQRQAIQQTDPGRPLGPRQVDNLRNGRPAGPHEQPEPIAHPPARPVQQPAQHPQPKAQPTEAHPR